MEFQSAIQKDDTEHSYWNFSGKCSQYMEQWEDALKAYDKAIALHKYGGEYYFNRANVYSRLQKYEEAIKDYKSAIKGDKESQKSDEAMKLKAKFEQGNCLRLMGRLNDSIRVLKEAVEMKAENPEVQNSLGLSFHENKEFIEAINCYTKAIQNSQHEKTGNEEDIRKAA